MEEDERMLASLVLLLRLPLGYDSDPAAGDGNGSSELKDALERHDCKLLRFAGRLVQNYVVTSDGVGDRFSSVGYAYLRLAVRILFLRYAASPSFDEVGDHGSNSNISNDDSQQQGINEKRSQNNDDRIWQYEQCVLASLLAAFRSRESLDNMGELDVEMIWVAQSLLVKLSKHTGQSKKQQESLSQMWTEIIDTVTTRGQGGKKGGELSSLTIMLNNEEAISDDQLNDEQLMIKTIHTILDRNGSSETNQEEDGNTQNNDWNLQFSISINSCIQSFLQTYSTPDSVNQMEENLPLWTQRTLFQMIHWSQQNQALSAEVYGLTLQYLHLCTLGICSNEKSANQQRQFCQFHSACVAREKNIKRESQTDDGADDFLNAIRSFIFYGLVVLGNVAPAPNAINSEENLSTTDKQKHQMSTGYSSSTIRGDIHLLVLELWHLFGPDWLYLSQSTALTTSKSDWWWFRSGEHSLGPTWPLCTLISLAAGEFRLGLGRWVTIVENGKDTGKDFGRLSSEIHCCARIVVEAVHLMAAIADDEEALVIWSPDAILHMRKSLEDALNSSVQYFNTLSDDAYLGQASTAILDDSLIEQNSFSEEREEVGRSCCLVLGTIAAELETDHLLAMSSAEVQNSDTSKEKNGPTPFVSALRSGILFCHSLGEKQLQNFNNDSSKFMKQRPYEYFEPLTHLLPCIMSLVSMVTSDQEESKSLSVELHLSLTTLCEKNCLLRAISRFLYRASVQWSYCFDEIELLSSADSLVVQGQDSIISMLELCIVIINELAVIGCSSGQKCPALTSSLKEFHHELHHSLDLWRRSLKSIREWQNQSLRSSTVQALDQVSQCMVILTTQIKI